MYKNVKEYIRQVLQEIAVPSQDIIDEIEHGLLASKFWQYRAYPKEPAEQAPPFIFNLYSILDKAFSAYGIKVMFDLPDYGVFFTEAGQSVEQPKEIRILGAGFNAGIRAFKIKMILPGPDFQDPVFKSAEEVKFFVDDILSVIHHEMTHEVQFDRSKNSTEDLIFAPSSSVNYWISYLETEAYASQLAFSLLRDHSVAEAIEILRTAFTDPSVIPASFTQKNWEQFQMFGDIDFDSPFLKDQPQAVKKYHLLRNAYKRFLKKTYQHLMYAKDRTPPMEKLRQ